GRTARRTRPSWTGSSTWAVTPRTPSGTTAGGCSGRGRTTATSGERERAGPTPTPAASESPTTTAGTPRGGADRAPGERRSSDGALPSETHWVDVAVAHEPTTFRSDWRGGTAAPATLHWPRGDWSIDSPVHYLRHHDTAEAWLRGQSQFWATYHRTLE